MVWVGAGVAVVSAGASMASAKSEGNKERRAQRSLNMRAEDTFTPVQVFGAGGSGANFGGAQTPSQVVGGVDFAQLAGLGAQNTAAGQGFVPGPTTASGTVIGPNSAGSAALGGQFDINPNSTAATEGLGVVNPDSLNKSDLGQINLNLGDLDPAAAGLRQLATQQIGQAGLAGQPNQQLQQNFANFQQAGQQFGNPGFGTLNTLLGNQGQAFGGAAQDLFSQQANPFQQGLQNSLFGGAQNSFNALPGTQEASRDQTLSLLRQQAQPFEERAFAGLQDNLFSTGRLGSTGGGLQTEAFARGLGQADLQRQLTAGQEGRNAQQAQLGLAQGQLGAGADLRGMQDRLLEGALSRFQGVSQEASRLSNQRFNTGQALTQDQFGRAGTTLSQTFAPEQLQALLQQQQLGTASAALGANQGIVDSVQNQATLGLQAMQAQSNARLGGVAGSSVSPQNLSTSTAFAQLSGALGDRVGLAGDSLAGMFTKDKPVSADIPPPPSS